jgi:excinuclease UvrABC helicase subunit UvrB
VKPVASISGEEIEVAKSLTPKQKEDAILKLEEEMRASAERLEFERAIALRDKIRNLRA